MITFGVVTLFVFHVPTQQWVLRNTWLWFTSLIVLLVTMIVLACCEGVRRKSPGNFILLFLFTGAMSFMMGVMSANFEIFEVMLAIGVRNSFLRSTVLQIFYFQITVVITFSLTIFAFQTKWDFTTMGGCAQFRRKRSYC